MNAIPSIDACMTGFDTYAKSVPRDQKGPGFTKFPNFYLERMLKNADLSTGLALLVTRMTVGWHRDNWVVTFKELCAHLACKRRQLTRILDDGLKGNLSLLCVQRLSRGTYRFSLTPPTEPSTSQAFQRPTNPLHHNPPTSPNNHAPRRPKPSEPKAPDLSQAKAPQQAKPVPRAPSSPKDINVPKASEVKDINVPSTTPLKSMNTVSNAPLKKAHLKKKLTYRAAAHRSLMGPSPCPEAAALRKSSLAKGHHAPAKAPAHVVTFMALWTKFFGKTKAPARRTIDAAQLDHLVCALGWLLRRRHQGKVVSPAGLFAVLLNEVQQGRKPTVFFTNQDLQAIDQGACPMTFALGTQTHTSGRSFMLPPVHNPVDASVWEPETSSHSPNQVIEQGGEQLANLTRERLKRTHMKFPHTRAQIEAALDELEQIVDGQKRDAWCREVLRCLED